ncbi:MAG: helix-turn-helix transcriptional regulator [Granulosicoccus sp.]
MHGEWVCELSNVGPLLTMQSPEERNYTEFTTESILLLGQMIKLARKQRGMSEVDLALQAGINRGTLNKIERGDLSISVGLFFEAATLVGLKLFDTDDKERLQEHRARIAEKISAAG